MSVGQLFVGIEITNDVLRSSKFKEVERALEKDKDATSELVEELEKLEGILKEEKKLIETNCNVKIREIVRSVGSTVYNGVQTGTKLTKAGSEAGKTVFKSLGKTGKIRHVSSIAGNAVFIAVDIRTLIQTSIDVHKGCKLKVVEDIQNVAQALEEEMEKPFFLADYMNRNL